MGNTKSSHRLRGFIASGVFKCLCILLVMAAYLLWAKPTLGVNEVAEYRTRSDDPGDCHVSGVYLATRRIQNLERTDGNYSVDVCPEPGNEVILYAPRVVLNRGFRAQKGSRFRAGIPAVDVHFVILDQTARYGDRTNPANPLLSRTHLRQEIDLLNQHFGTEDSNPLIRFRYKSTTTWNDLETNGLTTQLLVQYISDNSHTYDSPDGYGNLIQTQFNSTVNNLLRDPNAINVYIFDSQHTDMGQNTGHGRSNGNAPYILIDPDRLNPPNQAPIEHEMGHAFDLGHTCRIGAGLSTDTNIMGSSGYCDDVYPGMNYSGGNRSLGFHYEVPPNCPPTANQDTINYPNYGQVETVLWNASVMSRLFGMITSSLPIR